MITKITNNDLSEAKEKELAVLDFSAAWCGPCKMLTPVLEHLADDMPNVKHLQHRCRRKLPPCPMSSAFPAFLPGGPEARPGGRLPVGLSPSPPFRPS